MPAAPLPPPLPEKGGANTVSGRTNPYTSTSLSAAPTIYNSSTTPVTYNGFQWSFSTGVSWGRFLSGEPYIIVPAAGINITGVSYETSTGVFEDCPIIKTGYLSGASQEAGQGYTMWVNGSMKNPKPFWEQRDFNFTKNVLGATVFPWNYDERTSSQFTDRKGTFGVKGSLVSFGASMSQFIQFPIGLSAGDNLVTAKSSFNGDYQYAVQPQGTNKYVRWTNPEMNRMLIEKYGILTALSTAPTYADCYRPPVFWNGASLSSRPIFYRKDMVKNTEQYVIPLPEKNIKGITLNYNAENIINEQNNWNDFVNTMWISSHIPYYSGVAHQLAVSGYDLYNDNPNTSMGGYMGGGAKVKDKMMQAVYAPWVTRANRKKALDKVTQFAIDCWGIPNAGGIFNGDGGYHAAVAHPWIVWLGWLYNRPDMTKYYLGKQIQDRLSPGYIGGFTLTNPVVPVEYLYKAFLTQDYRQRYKVYGAAVSNEGFTGWVGTNPDISLSYGLTMTSKSPEGVCGFGWMYKVTDIPCAYSYTLSTIEVKGQLISGSFGVVVCDKDVVFRLNGLGPGSEKPLPAKLPLATNSSGRLVNRGFDSKEDCGSFWSFDNGAMVGMNLEIVSGPGAGNTAYRIIKGFNHFLGRGKIEDEGDEEESEENESNDLGVVKSLQYPSFILDRDFDNGAVTDQSVIKIYPSNKNSVDWGFSAGGWVNDLNSLGVTRYGSEQQTLYQQPSYNNIADEAIIKHYSLSNWLGITEDQFLVDYVKGVYFNENLPDATRRQKFYGSAYVGEIFSGQNELGGALVGKMLGISGNQYTPTFIDDLPGMFDNQPEVNLDGVKLEFIPKYIPSFSVLGGSGKTYSGYGITFSEPATILKITAVIDDKLFTTVNQPGLYALLKDLKIQTGPFLSNNILIEDREDEDNFKDKVSFIDFGKARGPELDIVSKDTSYVRKTINLQSLSDQGKTANFTFITNKNVMAGAVGLVPYPGNSCKLSSSYEWNTLSRDTGPNQNKFTITISNPQPSQSINLDNMYYCIASPRIGSGTWDMAEEYIYENWRKIENPVYINNTISFIDSNIPLGSSTGFTYGTNTTDNLIFFKYMIDKNYAVIPDRQVEITQISGLTANRNRIQSNTVQNWNTNILNTLYKIESIVIKNSFGNSGVFTYRLSGPSSSNDYRSLGYNHFRIWHNNYFDLEDSYGLRIFSTFQEDPVLGDVDTDFYGSLFKYNPFAGLSGINYYIPKHNSMDISIKDSEPPQDNGFYDYFIHGQTMNIYMPLHPTTLYHITNTTS
jgi:hypothetical protein